MRTSPTARNVQFLLVGAMVVVGAVVVGATTLVVVVVAGRRGAAETGAAAFRDGGLLHATPKSRPTIGTSGARIGAAHYAVE